MKKPKRGGWVWRSMTAVAEVFLTIGEGIVDLAYVITEVVD